jgi:peptidoglycan/LPS O-acetylase OafA/YrhL
MTRRHDIDALRALAFALLILYHWCMLYVGGGDWDWHLKSPYLAEWLQWPMLLVNRWRMDLVFLVSGLSVSFLLRGTGMGRFLGLRSWRLLLPLVFGCLVVVPIQPYAQGVANGLVEPGFGAFLLRYYRFEPWPAGAFDGWQYGFTWNHLWYLAYLWTYTMALGLLMPALRSRAGQRLRAAFVGLRGWALLLVPAIPLAVATILLKPHFDDTGDLVNDWYRHAIYFTAFLYGYWLGTDGGCWEELRRLRRRSLGLAATLFAAYLASALLLPQDMEVTSATQALVWTLRNAYVWLALCAILGWGRALLDRPFRWLPWANEAVYPWYVLHQSLIVLCAYWLLPLELGPVAEPLLVLAGTIAGCALLHAGIRRVRWLRPLFGMKGAPRQVPPALAARGVPA